MDKLKVGQVLEEIAQILELQNENIFKVRAYQNAARIMESVDKDLAALIQEKRLQELPGIGSGIAEKIVELVTTGRLRYYEDLKKKVPPGLLTMLKIPSLGPKKTKILWDKLGIKSIEALEKACRTGRLLKLKGFGQITQDKILQGISHLKQHAPFHRIDEALWQAEQIVQQLKAIPHVKRCEIAGSLRRKKEIVRDLDIVLSSAKPKAVAERLTRLSEVSSVIAEGPTKTSLLLNSGLQVDIRVVQDKEFPFALQHFTGSKEHNVALRSRAQSMGLKLNEYGLFPNGKSLSCKSEEDIYKSLKLHYIPPEMREDMGEIALAQKGPVPNLIEEKNLQGTFHAHSTYSDGKATLEEMVRQAQNLGLKYLGISEHSQSLKIANGLPPERVRQEHREIEELKKKYQITLFKGAEVDILADGSLDYDEKTLRSFDFVIAAVHTHFGMPEAQMTKRILKAIQHPAVTMLAHPTGRMLLRRESYAVAMPEVIAACAEQGVIVEMNCNPHRMDIDWRFGKLLREHKVLVSLNPDAHSTTGLKDLWYGIGIARKAWLTKKDVFNTLSAPEVKEYLEKRKR